MGKNYSWTVRVEGTRHEVEARDKGNSFNIFVDDEFRYAIRSDINLDIEEDLSIGGKRCRMVVYRGVPDLAVDGILLNADAELVRKEKQSRNLTLLAGVFLIVLGIVAAWAWTIIYANGETHFGGFMGVVFAAAAFFAGVWLITRTLRKRVY